MGRTSFYPPSPSFNPVQDVLPPFSPPEIQRVAFHPLKSSVRLNFCHYHAGLIPLGLCALPPPPWKTLPPFSLTPP